MSLPSEDPLQGHNLDEVKIFLDTRHREQYLALVKESGKIVYKKFMV